VLKGAVKVKIREFIYTKSSGETKNYKVLVQKESSSFFEGISLLDFSPEDREKILTIQKEFEDKLNPFYTVGYRKFNNASIQEEVIQK